MFATAEALQPRFLIDVLEGLSKPQKTLPSRWFYDQAGSELFEEITLLPEYYLTRTEIGILQSRAGQIAEAAGREAVLVEYGSGGSVKTRILIDMLDVPSAYVPIDVSSTALYRAADELRRDYPDLPVKPMVGDFLSTIQLPLVDPGTRRIGFFPGSTIGNLDDSEIWTFLSRARNDLGSEAVFVLGYDLRKDPSVLLRAYDDTAGVTAAFNINVLERIGREFDAEIDIDAFRHEARWNDEQSKIEMHLVSRRRQDMVVAGQSFTLEEGESIHTENSRKFEIAGMTTACALAGWRTLHTWTDERRYFAVALMQAA